MLLRWPLVVVACLARFPSWSLLQSPDVRLGLGMLGWRPSGEAAPEALDVLGGEALAAVELAVAIQDVELMSRGQAKEGRVELLETETRTLHVRWTKARCI